MPRLPHPAPEELRRDPLPPRGRTALAPEPADAAASATPWPGGRWGMPADPARLVAWLATDEATGVSPARTQWSWGRVTGQVVDPEGGFRR
ncbi:hypothetical protein ABZV59_00500 [Streptomyces anthocyanicus]